MFGKKEKPKPTVTSTMLYTRNRDMIAHQKQQNRYKHETTRLIAKLQKAVEVNKSLLAARRKTMLAVIHRG